MNRSFKDPTGETLDELGSELAGRLPIDHFAGVKLLVAVSGGADSVVMLHLLLEIWSNEPRLSPEHLAVAHFNHGLRGDDSDGDEVFVRNLSQSLSLPFHSERASLEPSVKDEDSLRRERYRFLQRTAELHGARYVMVAHHRDDNLETFLHHLFRGSGLLGLSGMRRHRPLGSDVVLYRPLLDVPQARLRTWLTNRSLTWREDASNQSTDYQRNWIRHALLPQVQQRYAGAADAIERTIEQQLAIVHTLQPLADQWIETHVRFDTHSLTIKRCVLDASLLGLVVRHLWDRQAWPRQGLGQSHLQQLWQAIQPDSLHADTTSSAFYLPGKLHVSCIAKDSLRIAADG